MWCKMKNGFFVPGLLCFTMLGFTACGSHKEPAEAHSVTVFAMDTVMELTIYGDEGLLEQAEDLILELDGKLSVTDGESEIFKVNSYGGGAVSTDTRELLERALALCGESEGALDISVYPVLQAWGFTTGEYRVPDGEEIETLLQAVDYRNVSIGEDGSVVLASGMEIDMGSVAKGYASDRLVELFTENGVDSGILNLGGNVYAMGTKPDGSPWRVAITAPTEGGYAGVVEVEDRAVVTSGGYERYFEQDGIRYHHIIDPAAGYPVDNGFLSVTVIGSDGLACDALSTALFVMGPAKAAEFWEKRGGFEAVFITSEEICITEGLEGNFSPLGSYQDREVRVLRHD